MKLCPAKRSEPRAGLDIGFPGDAPCEVSDHWTVAGWDMQFARLQPHQSIALGQANGLVHLKVITGQLVEPALTPFALPGTVRTTVVNSNQATAGSDGAIVAILIAGDSVPENIHSMDQLAIDGPEAEVFEWQSFYDRFGGLDVFEGVDGHIVPGFHLLDGNGTEIAYVHFWTMGKGGDASTHNHSRAPSEHAPAFAEIHWAFNNGTGSGGMYQCAEPGAPRTAIVMQRGEEHAPLWVVDLGTQMPNRRPNGAVEYGWHGWEGGTDDDPTQAFDFVAAFEINPDHAPLVLS